MKTFILLLVGSLSLGFIQNQTEKNDDTTYLKVEIWNLPNSNGTVTVLLYNNAKGFPANPKMVYKINKVKIANNKAITIWNGIPKGSYAISVFHDENGNGEFDKSWFGSPKESYGFSNIPSEYCGTPSFNQTAFVLSNEPKTITINLIKR